MLKARGQVVELLAIVTPDPEGIDGIVKDDAR